jgi:hypothetical protein
MKAFAIFILSLAFLCAAPFAAAQSFTASIVGTVRDASGALVPEAAVVAINTGTNGRTEARSNQQGNYTLLSLPPGQYMLEVQAAGFKKFVRSGIVLQVQQQALIDLALEVGAVSESISVIADAPLLEATTSTFGKVVENRRIMDLPLNTRNVYSLIFLTPGVSGGVGNNYNNVSFWINGSGNRDIMIDGVTATQPTVNGVVGISVFPSVDAIEEYKVLAANFSAEFGRAHAGVLNVVYKSGGNALHGSAYEFLRNSVLDSSDFFANRNGSKLTSFKRSQFGAMVSGPIKRDRTFFMAAYEGLRERGFGSTTQSVPTELERRGDFSQSLASNGQQIRIFNPFTTRANPSGSGFIRDQFANNSIPGSLMDPVALNVMKYYPQANQAGHPVTRRDNFYKTATNPLNTDNWDIRVDHNISATQRIFSRYSHRLVKDPSAAFFPEDLQIAEGRINEENRARNAVVEYNNTLSPTTIFTGRLGFARAAYLYDNQGLGFVPSQLGLPTSIDSAVDRQMFPAFSVAGYKSLGGGDHRWNPFMSYSATASLAKVKGPHSLKLGFEGRLIRVNVWEARDAGNFGFTAGFTQGPNPSSASSTAGNGFASLLLGTAGSGNLIQAWKNVASQSIYYAGYIQDDWRVTSKLTLNLGLRYDLDTPRTERYDRMNYFDPNAASPLASRVPGYSNLKGGLVFAGVDGNSRRQQAFDKNDLGPRFGFAYQVNGKTVVRGGYGHYFGSSLRAAQGTVGPFGFRTENPLISSLDGITPFNLLRNPWPQGFTTPPGSKEGLLTQTGANMEAVLWNESRTPWTMQWSFTLQRELPSQTRLEVAYVANRGLQLSRGGEGALNMNQLHPQYLALGSQLNNLVDNPFYSAVGRGIHVNQRVALGRLLTPYPQFTTITPLFTSGASSTYHSLQATVTKRLTRGFQFDGAYTWSKLLSDTRDAVVHQDYYDLHNSRVPSLNPHRLVMSYLYELPFGRGRAFGSNAPGVVEWLIGGWQVNGITSIISGSYLSVSASNTAGLFNTNTYPVSNGKSPKLSGPVDQRLERYFDTSTLTQPAAFTLGNTIVLSDVLGDSTRNFDLSLFKQFTVTERVKAQFRTEFLNAFNTPRFGNPNTGVTSTSFGRITSQSNSPRQIQFGLKLLW